MTAERPRVDLLMFGGTIAMRAGPNGVTPGLDAEDLLAALGPLTDRLDVHPRTARIAASANLGLDDIRAMVDSIAAAARQGTAGVVIVQGTDTLEEVAFALDLVAPPGTAVVLTGAMRNPTLAGADGLANLAAALAVAADPFAREAGPLVVIADEIHSARWVRKGHASRPHAFNSEPLGPVGWVSEGRPRILAASRRGRAVPLPPPDAAPKRVGLVTTWLGDDGVLLQTAGEAGFDGLVIEAFGAGHLSEAVAEIALSLAGRIPVVLATSTGQGEVFQRTYGYAGAEIHLREGGLIAAGPLSGRKARLQLELLLCTGLDRDGVAFAADMLPLRL
jgi:L-asparaginase